MNRITSLFGALLLFCSAQANSASAQYTLSTLVTFNVTNGAYPNGPLIADASGNLYGTTSNGGASNQGTVFELAAGTHALTTLASFNGTNGAGPTAGLLADTSGNLYGTTQNGGASPINGVVFEVAAGTHALSTLVAFNGTNGTTPQGSLVADTGGNLYGTTFGGGVIGATNGTVFEVAATTHAFSTLVTFNGANGANPQGGLIADASGNLFGTTGGGGTGGQGIVFEVAAGTHAFSTLVSFNGTNGAGPYGGLLADASGNLYGTMDAWGANGYGTVFEVAAGTHALSTLVSFNGANGASPQGVLIADANGNLYGTTLYGGANNVGTVFEVAAGTHALSTLATFNGANGAQPWDGLLADASGNLYGTTSIGGTRNFGTVFELSPVAEPATLALAGFALAMVLLFGHRRRAAIAEEIRTTDR